MRRLMVEVGILRTRAAPEKLFASTTCANTTSEFRSVMLWPKDFSGVILPGGGWSRLLGIRGALRSLVLLRRKRNQRKGLRPIFFNPCSAPATPVQTPRIFLH